MCKDLRSFLNLLEKEGDLKKVEREVDPKFEVAAILNKLSKTKGPAVLFEKVKGYNIPIAGNICGTRERISKALKVKPQEILKKYVKALKNPAPPKTVSSGPVKEEKITGDINLQKALPVLTHYEEDAGPYITAGVLIYHDPETGCRGTSIHRLQVKEKNKIVMCIATRPFADYYTNAEKRGEPLKVAITIGHEPSFLLASCAEVPVSFDKLCLVKELRGDDLEMVKCETMDISVPAYGEITLEGEVYPKVREQEGPVGEVWGYYSESKGPILNIKTITHRKNPIYQSILFASTETLNLMNIPLEATLYMTIERYVPTIKNVYMDSLFHAVISIDKKSEGDAKNVLLAALSLPWIKHAVVVDDDVNIYSWEEVLWAIDTRFQGDKDLVVVSGVPSIAEGLIDPSSDSLTAKVGVDATRTLTKPLGKFKRIKIPGEDKVSI